jgi:hypothetical protein
MKKIKLTKGKYALVDNEDFQWINSHKWQYGVRGYATKNLHIGMKNGKRLSKLMLMHREIIKTPTGLFTDHINGNKLDNRKENLRICSRQQNAWNIKKSSHNTSGFKGVSEDKRNLKNNWQAYITLNNKKIHLGYFSTAEEAAKEYNKAALNFFGEFANINKVKNYGKK